MTASGSVQLVSTRRLAEPQRNIVQLLLVLIRYRWVLLARPRIETYTLGGVTCAEVRMIKHLFLDLDGTLTDPSEGIVRCIQHALHTMGRKPPAAPDLERYIGPPLGRSFQELLNTSDPDILTCALSAYRARFATHGLFENRVYPEIYHFLQALNKAGRLLYLVTVKPRVFAHKIADHFHLFPYLRSIYAPELTELVPDKSFLVAKALSHERLAPIETCMIGDRADDVIAARTNGITAVAVTWGYGTRTELESSNPDLIVESVQELLQYLGTA